MNNIHIYKRLQDPLHAKLGLTEFFCGLLHSQETKGIKMARYHFFHRNKFVAEGEEPAVPKGFYTNPRRECRVGDDGIGQPVVLYQMASSSERDYCDLCRYMFYEFGGMIMSVEQYKIQCGQDFYPQVIKDIEAKAKENEV